MNFLLLSLLALVQAPDGEYTHVDADGHLRIDGQFEAGVRTGRWRHRHPSGEVAIRGRYNEGRQTGKWEYFHEDGTPKATGKFKRGHPIGEWEFFGTDGDRIERLSGEHAWIEGERAGALSRYSGSTLDGEMHGLWVFEWSTGGRALEAWFLRGRPIDEWRFTHPGGVYDPKFVSGKRTVQRDGEPLTIRMTPGVFELPRLPEDPARPEASGAEITAEILQGVPALAPLPGTPDYLPAKIDVALSAFIGDPEGEILEAERLTEWRQAAVPQIFEALRALDLSDSDDVLRGTHLQQLLVPILGGGWFGWQNSVEPEAQQINRLGLLRLAAFWAIAGHNSDYWTFDLDGGPGEEDQRQVLGALFRPPVDPRSLQLPEFQKPRIDTVSDAARPAVLAALDWLARHQSASGLFDVTEFVSECADSGATCEGVGDPTEVVGVSALAVLAILENGYTTSDARYGKVLEEGLLGLLMAQDPDTGLIRLSRTAPDDNGQVRRVYSPWFLTSHALATEALCVASASSSSPALRRDAHKAVAYLLSARNPYGGWHYEVPPAGENDTISTASAIQALVAARQAGIRVPEEAFQGGVAWFTEVFDPATGRVGYDDLGSSPSRYSGVNDEYPARSSEGPTAVALAVLPSVLLNEEEHPWLRQAADLIVKALPEWDVEGFRVDQYYWMFGARAMHAVGGRHWKAWGTALNRALLPSQQAEGCAAGSWDPVGAWGQRGGRVYATAIGARSFCHPAGSQH